jgi:hypothetical protein
MFLRLRIVAGEFPARLSAGGTADLHGGPSLRSRRLRASRTDRRHRLAANRGRGGTPFRYALSMPQSRPTPLPDHATYDALLRLLGHLRDAYTVLQSDELVKVVDFGDVTRKMLAFGLTQNLERVVSALVRHFPAKQYGEMRRAVEKEMDA